ncbi:hypothetical protein [Bacillus suaedae]|uniref:Uncharacterized protein n=1 Tax=Halalkalibacter suaedae TaxID=2822140 RepID=A0A940WYE7_9BACI|nr:hypothetical protein [Bacillus suaedae]MBP3950319.1 hypothetical protein [Bacillus suaedae]
MKNVCPVCGFDQLAEAPYDKDNNPSYEICDCCGFEFGYDDDSEGKTFEEYRKEWISNGCQWFNEDKKPQEWDVERQLSNL